MTRNTLEGTENGERAGAEGQRGGKERGRGASRVHSYGGPRAPAVLAMADGQTAAPGPQGFALAPALKNRLPRQGAARPARPDYFQSITAYDTASVVS